MKQRQVVKVGAVEFPPYIHIESDGKVTGILADLLEFMNSTQKDYEFQAMPISAMRRHGDFKNGVYDLSFFDNIEWGWDRSAVDASDVYMKGKEIYIARKKVYRDPAFFSDFTRKNMVGILGYHYGFAGHNADPNYLRKKYNMQLVSSNEGCVKMILFDRGDIAVVSDVFLNGYFKKNPDDKSKIMISTKVDQQYSHRVMVRKNIRPTVQEINLLLTQFKKSKKFKEIQDYYYSDLPEP
ncbi:substrate-binding periplasmic protein [Bdellovibrio sp. HCB337]|uniref:substrate-binding periplasmic protein n=1 Tax=Bdellovibrio sp. HCB337 TaxID=3394358 RepID=UPI0039A50CD0